MFFRKTVSSFLLAAIIFGPNHALAQAKVGTAVVDGKKAELFSDGTWRFEGAGPENACVTIATRVRFCGAGGKWQRLSDDSSEIDAQFSYDDRHYAFYIFEGVGTNDGFSLEFIREAALENFAAGAGIAPSDVTVFGIEETSVDGLPAETVTYGGKLFGADVVFNNTIVVQEDFVLQVGVYAVGKAPTERLSELSEDFISLTKID